MKQLQDILAILKHISLTERERFVMRAELQDHMSRHPAHMPLYRKILNGFGIFANSLSLGGSPWKPAFAVFALVVIFGGGTSYAAQGSLPTDALYAIKIYFNESIEGGFAVSSEAKVAWNAARAERRLEEAETLAKEGKLTPEVNAVIRQGIDVAAEDFNKNAAEIAKTPNGAVTVAGIQSSLEAKLSAHAQILAALSSNDPQTTNDAKPILSTTRVRAQGAAHARLAAEAKVTQTATDTVKTAATAKKETAQTELHQVETMSLQSKIAAPIATATEEIKQTISDGNQSLENGDYGSAFKIFQAAIRAVQETKVHIDAEERLNTPDSDVDVTKSQTP